MPTESKGVSRRRWVHVGAGAVAMVLVGVASTHAQTPVFTTIHDFTADAANGGPAKPNASLIHASDGNFYGTTEAGGSAGLGTVFRMTPAGVVTTMHSFVGNPDGADPRAALIQATDGNFYGTTYRGGTSNLGTVFRITLNGTLTVLHSFNGGEDGGRLTYRVTQGRDGNLYGTTTSGGSGVSTPTGTIFRMTLDGSLTTLHTFSLFQDSSGAGLIQGVDGNFYGTGVGICGNCIDAGIAYRMNAAGNVEKIGVFVGIGGPGGGFGTPGPLVEGLDGNFYGVAVDAGDSNVGGVFRVGPSGGGVNRLKSFSDVPPSFDALIQTSDMHFYGTANGCNASGCHGYVFQMDATGDMRQIGPTILGNERVDEQVSGLSGLVEGRDGNLYGTTRGDATHAGTVYRISRFASCSDALNVSYSAGTLNLGFTLMTSRPATWKTWLAVAGPPEESKLLWSVQLPTITPVLSFNVPIPGFPQIGDLFVLTALTTPIGTLCADWEVVNTGR